MPAGLRRSTYPIGLSDSIRLSSSAFGCAHLIAALVRIRLGQLNREARQARGARGGAADGRIIDPRKRADQNCEQ